MRISTTFLDFEINEKGNRAGFILNERPETAAMDSGFWRLILDDGMKTEIPVYSTDQEGTVRSCDRGLIVEYDHLVSEYGDEYPIRLQIRVEADGSLLRFTSAIENHDSAVRVNECFCPTADFTALYGPKEEDHMLIPIGLGTRVANPWKVLQDKTCQYYIHDEREVFWHVHYPSASMCWMGIESGGRFLYMARYDERIRCCFLSARQKIHSDPTNIMLTVDHFPMAKPGERVEMPPVVLGVLEGDWRSGAKEYRAWADRGFYRIQEKAEWVQNLTGWQRIIMRSQYGEDYYVAEDLPEIYKTGAKYGIHTLFLFAWWKDGMDRNYPYYLEPYPGAFQKLKENIQKVRDMGGRVILECNCHFLDPSNDYFREHGDELKIININGDDIRPSFTLGGFVYSGRGEFRVTYGAKVFPLACSCTQLWRDQVMSQMELMNGMDPDCLFMDCYGQAPYQPCFNSRHEHGNRVDEEWVGHRKLFAAAEQYCREQGKVLATEVVTDIAASYNQFVHGLINVSFEPSSDAYPPMFRYTFPEVITTDRGIRHSENDFDRQLRWSLAMGLRLDAELYVCRCTIDKDPKYAAEVGKYTEKLEQYGDFMLRGTFTVLDASPVPDCVKRAEYYSEDGKKILRVLYNISREPVEVRGMTLDDNEMRFDVFDKEEYLKNL